MQVWRVIYGDSYGTRERKQAAHGTPSMFFRVISFFHRSRRCWGNINEGKCQCHFFLPSMESRYRVFRWKIVSLSRLTRWSSHIIRNNFVLHYHYLACIFSIHHFLVIIRMIVKRTLFRNRLFLVEFVRSWLLKRASNCKKKKKKREENWVFVTKKKFHLTRSSPKQCVPFPRKFQNRALSIRPAENVPSLRITTVQW